MRIATGIRCGTPENLTGDWARLVAKFTDGAISAFEVSLKNAQSPRTIQSAGSNREKVGLFCEVSFEVAEAYVAIIRVIHVTPCGVDPIGKPGRIFFNLPLTGNAEGAV